jgi:hypothetical protein
MKWPSKMKVEFGEYDVHYLRLPEYNRAVAEVDGDCANTAGVVDFASGNVYICLDYGSNGNAKAPEEVLVTIIHELIHCTADTRCSANLAEEAAVNNHAVAIVDLLVEMGIRLPKGRVG